MSGDGGFSMLMGDFLTLVQQNLPVKVVIFNNSTLGFVAMEMKASGFLETGTDLKNPDFAAVARAAGVHAIRVEDPTQLETAVTNTEELSMPPKIEAAQVKGFGLWTIKAVMNGRGDQLLDLAVSNFLSR
jgi:pyruvate dehydrogenase (quinone)